MLSLSVFYFLYEDLILDQLYLASFPHEHCKDGKKKESLPGRISVDRLGIYEQKQPWQQTDMLESQVHCCGYKIEKDE